MKKANIALFLFVTMIPTYFLTGLLLLLANKIRLIEAFKRYYPTLTLDAILGNYPKIWQSLLISFVVCLLIMLKLFYQPKKNICDCLGSAGNGLDGRRKRYYCRQAR